MSFAMTPTLRGPDLRCVEVGTREVPLPAAPSTSARALWFATAVVVTACVLMPLMALDLFTAYTTTPVTPLLVVASVVVAVLQGFVALSAAWDRWPRVRPWALGALVVVVLGTLPMAPHHWFGNVQTTTALLLVVVRPVWSPWLILALTAVAYPVAETLYGGGWGGHYALSLPIIGLGLGIPLWAVRAFRRLARARAHLLHQAVALQRLQLEQQLRASMGGSLAELDGRAAGILHRVRSDPPGAAVSLLELGARARAVHATARSAIRTGRSTVAAELRRTASLLEAAGVPTAIVLQIPGDVVPDDAASRILRTRLRALLLERPPGCVLTLRADGTVSLEPSGTVSALPAGEAR